MSDLLAILKDRDQRIADLEAALSTARAEVAALAVSLDRYRWDEDYDQRDAAIAQKTHNQTRSITSRKGEST